VYWKPNPDLYPPYLRTWIRRGKGVRKGLEYRPWLRVRDVPSRGTSAQIGGILVQRSYQLLSGLETTYFFLVERQKSTVDIQECWPIFDIDRTVELCATLGVRHQYRGIYPAPFTIDFLITESVDGQLKYRAASIKTPEDAADPEVRRRLEVEHRWCSERGIPWTLIDTSQFDKVLHSNLLFMRTWFRHHYIPDAKSEARFLQSFRMAYVRNVPLAALIKETAKTLRIPDTLATDTFRYCAWTDGVPVSLRHALSLNMPLVLREARDHA
jgi:hypothetical protein